jgi:YegS/Rv2252/BmrU family lipid kinase
VTRTALVIHNPAAGRPARQRGRKLDDARRSFERHGIPTELVDTRTRGDAVAFGRRAGTEGYAFAVVCGGDGTLNEVVNGLMMSPSAAAVAVGVLPAGTANILARELGLRPDIALAAEQIATAQTRRIALGLATPADAPDRRRYFVSVAGAGPDGEIVHSTSPALKRRFGVWAYWWQGVRVTVGYTFPRFHVTSGTWQVDASFVSVGRTRLYGGPFVLTPDARLDQNAFDVLALTTRSPAAYVGYLPAAWRGSLRGEGIHHWKTAGLVCEPHPGRPVYAHVDGEPMGSLPVEFSIVPDALTLMSPAAERRA